MGFQSLEQAVFEANSLADPVEFVMANKKPDELFNDRHGHRIALMHYMVMVKAKAGIDILADIGADPNIRSSDGDTPLGMAVISGSLELVQALIEKGADIDLPDTEGNTPLHMALINKNKGIANYLIEQGANEELPNLRGITARQIRWYNIIR